MFSKHNPIINFENIWTLCSFQLHVPDIVTLTVSVPLQWYFSLWTQLFTQEGRIRVYIHLEDAGIKFLSQSLLVTWSLRFYLKINHLPVHCCLNSIENTNQTVTGFARCAERTLTVWTASSLNVRHLGSSESWAIISSGIRFPQEESPAEEFWPTLSGCLLLAMPEKTEVPSNLWLCLCNRAGHSLNPSRLYSSPAGLTILLMNETLISDTETDSFKQRNYLSGRESIQMP